jgi:hypothetical protein
MSISILYRVTIISVVIILMESSCISFSESQLLSTSSGQTFTINNGQILFAPMNSGITYLIDRNGTVQHTWSSNFFPGEAVLWVGDGTILRSIKTDMAGYGGSGGGIQEVQWDGTLVWDFRYNNDGNLSHHDIKLLPNGDVLFIAWEAKTRDDAVASGRNPNHIAGDTFYPGKIIEVRPSGPTTGTIVWEWHAWDHLIQDYDPFKTNFGNVGRHPELVDINFGEEFMGLNDWLHSNSLDYNPELDQILISVHNFNEIWVIDHSTTTEEAAGHTGGNSGKGGDLLYRWGNPQAYRAGSAADQKFFGQHDATWIQPGCPGEGDILVFNNGFNRPDGAYSSVDEISPPIDDNGTYSLQPDSAYGPVEETWTYIADPPTSFFSNVFSSAERLTDGHTLVCSGNEGIFFEVTPDGTTVWEYISPYPSPLFNQVFKAVFIPLEAPPENSTPDLDCAGSLSWTEVEPGTTVTGSFQLRNIGDTGSLLNWTINSTSISWGTWSFNPPFGQNLTPELGQITVQVSVIAPNEKNSYFDAYIKVENQQNPQDFDVIPVTLSTPGPINPVQEVFHHGLFDFLRHFVFHHDTFLLRTFLRILNMYENEPVAHTLRLP